MPYQNHFGDGLGIHDATGNTASCLSAFDYNTSLFLQTYHWTIFCQHVRCRNGR